MKQGDPAKAVDLDLRGARTLILQVTDAGDGVDYDHANWADARFLVSGTRPQTMDRPVPAEAPVILTPGPGPAPRINGPLVYGCRPGNPFLYRIPTQGQWPMRFSAQDLPTRLQLDAREGIVTGTAPPRGQFVSGDLLALPPPTGWNHWYTHYDRITDRLMREAADVMVASGMADVGYQYVNIDDCWMFAPKHSDPLRVGALRNEQGEIRPNGHFPDMKALTAYVHSKGLKAGIYTSLGPLTCGGFAGSHGHEAQDAKTFADWGFDFRKYDWCSYGDIAKDDPAPELEKFKKPYALMGRLLREQSRDIVLNLCQYGMGKVWEWGAEVGGHSWRTAGDLGFELDRIFDVALANAKHAEWQRPGAWNDPDYIQIEYIGAAHGMGLPQPCPLTPNEQYSFMSLWSLMASPLFFSGDMGRLDEFTINVLCNAEVIEVNQDPLGRCARVVPLTGASFAMVKDLADGSKAVGLFNRAETTTVVAASLEQLGLAGIWRSRDLWRQVDLGRLQTRVSDRIGRHGAFMIRLWPEP